jgi:hypothetical protein
VLKDELFSYQSVTCVVIAEDYCSSFLYCNLVMINKYLTNTKTVGANDLIVKKSLKNCYFVAYFSQLSFVAIKVATRNILVEQHCFKPKFYPILWFTLFWRHVLAQFCKILTVQKVLKTSFCTNILLWYANFDKINPRNAKEKPLCKFA